MNREAARRAITMIQKLPRRIRRNCRRSGRPRARSGRPRMLLVSSKRWRDPLFGKSRNAIGFVYSGWATRAGYGYQQESRRTIRNWVTNCLTKGAASLLRMFMFRRSHGLVDRHRRYRFPDGKQAYCDQATNSATRARQAHIKVVCCCCLLCFTVFCKCSICSHSCCSGTLTGSWSVTS